jgi:hypothetical protein
LNYIDRFLDSPDKDYYILCRDIKDQENKRVSLFHMRKKMGSLFEETIGITKKMVEDIPYVVLYKRSLGEGFRMIEGKLVPDVNPNITPERSRRIKLMQEDGMSEEEIQNILREEENG